MDTDRKADDLSELLPDRPLTPEQKERLNQALAEMVPIEERRRLELLLLVRMKQHKGELEKMLKIMNDHWTYEDHFYRFYHCSFKVYSAQNTTEQAVKLLRHLLPERGLNKMFEQIVREGTGKEFQFEHNQQWEHHTRPMLEAFSHAKFMVEMAVRYADLPAPPQPMPSGWAAFLYLYDLR
ncbi:MAG: hypothetical protein C5B50_11835 [Verrucomicrobia bacterium]|nr:MAG: hypothetical protein C5B50_11835 [Verrucomicrobiota bacterium]